MYITILFVYLQVSSIKEVGSRYKVLVVKEGTAVSLHSNSGFMGIQERTSVSDKDSKSERKGGKHEIELR